ncbi:MAG: polyprenyl synthetase family protein [Clostridiales Family XIII bacterium]|jgi:geranylgeranyl diphosphate synthase type II|nr:polyprenyl synthetase family protein [Clostridiales Family XIII bacterium]
MIEYPEYRRLKYLVEEHLLDFLPEIDPLSLTLYDGMRYSLKSEGKRIRPVLLLAACELAGGETATALPYACAVEYIHTYSLIHDDLPAMDDDDVRRGRPTNHKVYGEAIAILAGDGLISSAFEAMNKDLFLYFDRTDELKQRIRAVFELSKGCGCRGMIAGQIADMEAEAGRVSPELLDYIHINKTAALIESAIIAGAYIGGADEELLGALRVYGENLGLAFQIADDILDVTGDERETGKRTGQDSAMRKAAYPALCGLGRSKERLSELTGAAVGAMARYRDNAEFFVEIAKALAERTG